MLSTICSAKQKRIQMCAELRHCQRWVMNRERQRVPQWRTIDEKTSVSLWRDPDKVPHCRILSSDKTEWRIILATLSTLGDICFYISLPAESVTTAILKYASFHSWCCLMNRKLKSFKQCFCWNNVRCKKVTSVQCAVFPPWLGLWNQSSFCDNRLLTDHPVKNQVLTSLGLCWTVFARDISRPP